MFINTYEKNIIDLFTSLGFRVEKKNTNSFMIYFEEGRIMLYCGNRGFYIKPLNSKDCESFFKLRQRILDIFLSKVN